MTTEHAETRAFEADVARLLHLMVHSVYSTPDVFLRELVSNAADACEKLRQSALVEPALLADDPTLKITITVDPDAQRLVIEDNGIGMSREELIENLGTMARSGTEKFRQALEEKDAGKALIGQFGVGFYSAFMVANEVIVDSHAADHESAWRWRSDGSGEFQIEPAEDAPARGTRVTLLLREDHKDYAEEATIERLIRHHSAHVPVPILIRKAGESDDRELVDGTALWAKPKSEITEEEYTEFYRFTAGAFDTPALTLHTRAEGRQEYTTLLFVPEMAPFDLFDPERKGRVKLYVRRIFITDDAPILPGYLRFVRGLVDSEDLPLNLSREMLQTNPMLAQIRTATTKRLLTELKKLADNKPETYQKVWDSFGPVLKEGLYEDAERRDELFALTRFATTKHREGGRTLADYVAAMKENQTAIFYAVGENPERVAASPHLEGFAARDVEVLLLSDPVDAFWVRTALGFEGKPFKSVTQGSADLDAIAKAKHDDHHVPEEAKASDVATLAALVKQTLGERVSDVRASARLATSAACLVAPEGGYDRQMEKIVSRHGQGGFGAKPILELNPSHPLIRTLSSRASEGGASDRIADAAWLLLGSAEILDGETPSDPAAFNQRLISVMGTMFAVPGPSDHADHMSVGDSAGGDADG
ncbi:molecular chaperone HtpG [Acuticoccus sp. M5D2P5]|uniref:molecular chaperone HtpG n=1 Tax=Acuticoccus kalidii TaxID=2910977 RepID=UPI001F2FCBB2|nr:molecular chaperone HtpG [Acuticoccus kalidii]MCF3936408.1 molecular chaperone HtpG [Acuticoccus kalidii]